MINYYNYFGFSKNANICEVVEKTSSFLTYAREKIAKLPNDRDKEELLNSLLTVVNDVCRIFSGEDERRAYDENLRTQTVIAARVHRTKTSVVPFPDFYEKAKQSWLRILNSLIPYLESEKQMSFLMEDNNLTEILSFMLENMETYRVKEVFSNNCVIPIEVVKKSFEIAKARGRKVVKVEDIVTSIIDCEYLEKTGRNNLAIMLFDKWYETPSSEKEMAVAYRKNKRL